MFIQEYAENFQANNIANQSKLQLSLLEMEQHNLLLIATVYIEPFSLSYPHRYAAASYAVAVHMEALSSGYMLFYFLPYAACRVYGILA